MTSRTAILAVALFLPACESRPPAVPGNASVPPVSATPESAATAAPRAPGSGGSAAQPKAGMGNPASKACIDKGGKLETLEDANGQSGVCVFPDGSRCQEWLLFRGECTPGSCRSANGACK